MLNIEAIRQIFKQKVSQKGYFFEERKSTSTNSWYFKIYSGSYSLLFRVSDHKGRKKITTLRVDKHTNYKMVEKFITNRCEDLGTRIVKSSLGIK